MEPVTKNGENRVEWLSGSNYMEMHTQIGCKLLVIACIDMAPVYITQTTDRFNVEIDHTKLITPSLEKGPHTRTQMGDTIVAWEICDRNRFA